MDIKEMQKEVDDWIGRFEEGYWQPMSMLARLIEETGELAREINHHYGEKPKKPGEAEGNIALELADIMFIVISFANSLNIDLEKAFRKSMEKKENRDKNRFIKK